MPGLRIRVSPDGAVSWIFKYREKDDPTQRFRTLGRWPGLHPEPAREEAPQIRATALLGRDLWEARMAGVQAAARARAEERRACIPRSDFLDLWRTQTEAKLARRRAAGEASTYEAELLRIERAIICEQARD